MLAASVLARQSGQSNSFAEYASRALGQSTSFRARSVALRPPVSEAAVERNAACQRPRSAAPLGRDGLWGVAGLAVLDEGARLSQ